MPETSSETAWSRACPHCGARLQGAARACWQCRAELADPDAEQLDYRPTNAEETHALSVSILAGLAVFLPVCFLIWVLSLIDWW
ncbi:MAG TPA: hypothetical protein VF175_18305 [Lacipirellula sp.]